ncbi:metallophosphoesterase [Serinibacter salmoneus]|uniref:Calcineurin-like phosphoesterase family protein n=1 Tax=Serinibacter salmoneus TaxID=556530 RepID=A0A2A9D0L3_9MICO|nr:metallophosphoesterase [Serinibacter salmoneus]PFG20183.1 calcineurin-like phosphoesterase family protein [Serinibacter salmoneus]
MTITPLHPLVLSDPYLQLPGPGQVHVAWASATRPAASAVLVGDAVAGLTAQDAARAGHGEEIPGVRMIPAHPTRLTRTAEDADSDLPAALRPPREAGIVPREVWRLVARVADLAAGRREPYRVVSVFGPQPDPLEVTGGAGHVWLSDVFTLAPAPAPGAAQRILLTSDHQAEPNTPANLQLAAATLGPLDAVFLAGDMVNRPDRASEWFDGAGGAAFFATMQGRADRADSAGASTWHGAPLLQHVPLFPAIGNHEVQGRRIGQPSIAASFAAPVPRAVAEAELAADAEARAALAASADPTSDPTADPAAQREAWLRDRSFSTTTYEELFTLPSTSPGAGRYYAVTVGEVRLVVLYATRIWRSAVADPDPADRVAASRFQEAADALDEPTRQGQGDFLFDAPIAGSAQHAWLRQELASEAFRAAGVRMVMLHEGPYGIGTNVMPPFTPPVRIEEREQDGALVGIRYEYPGNVLLRDLVPLLEEAEVDLVFSGHSHLFTRFTSPGGVHYVETSNTGNTHGAFHATSGREREVPPAPWRSADHLASGSPGGMEPAWPTAPLEGVPYVASNDHVVFTLLDTGAREVVSYVADVRDPGTTPRELDRFALRPRGTR